MFKDRNEAGKFLARRLVFLKEKAHLVVAIPRGGIVTASEVSRALNLPLVPLVVKKVPTFGEPELAAGAVGPEGLFVGERSPAAEEIVAGRIKKYGGLADFDHKEVILVDDGVATGTTIETAISYLRKKGVEKITVAVPVIAKNEFEKLGGLVHKVVALEIPDEFRAIGEFYQDFTQVTDAEVIQLLDKQKMKLLIGLGNPGKEYVETRHNVGHMAVDQLQKLKIPGVVVRKTDVFMNESGKFVKKLVDKYNLDLSNLYIIHDDLDIPLGEYKIQFGRGPKDHNGLGSIDEILGTDQYWHVRIGIDNRTEDKKEGKEYVLQNFSDEEKEVMQKTIKEVCRKLETSLKNIN